MPAYLRGPTGASLFNMQKEGYDTDLLVSIHIQEDMGSIMSILVLVAKVCGNVIQIGDEKGKNTVKICYKSSFGVNSKLLIYFPRQRCGVLEFLQRLRPFFLASMRKLFTDCGLPDKEKSSLFPFMSNVCCRLKNYFSSLCVL